MSTAIAIYHGRFGRASLYLLDRPLTKHAHREGHLTFHVEGPPSHMMVGSQRCDIDPGVGCAVNPWELHDFNPSDREHGHLLLVLYIRPMWFLDFARTAGAALRFAAPRIEVDHVVSNLVSKLVTLLLEGSTSELFDGVLFELTEECFAQSQRACGRLEVTGTHASFNDVRVRRSIDLMTEHLGECVELDAIARESGLSRPHFFKLFRKHTGLTPNLFLNTLRMEKAIESLTETDRSLSDISFDLGFSSQSSFSRFFAANVGMAPTVYRRVAQRLT